MTAKLLLKFVVAFAVCTMSFPSYGATENVALQKCVQIRGDEAVIKLSGVCDPTLDFKGALSPRSVEIRLPGERVTTAGSSSEGAFCAKKCSLAIKAGVCDSYSCMKAAFAKFFKCLGII
jgi:hypothetical protein